MSHTALGSGGEFDRIRGIWKALGDRAAGLGDDCAIVQVGGATLAVSSDLSVEGTHFRLGWLTPEEIGYRACAAALSDLAAVAAQPAGFLDGRETAGNLGGAVDDSHDSDRITAVIAPSMKSAVPTKRPRNSAAAKPATPLLPKMPGVVGVRIPLFVRPGAT